MSQALVGTDIPRYTAQYCRFRRTDGSCQAESDRSIALTAKRRKLRHSGSEAQLFRAIKSARQHELAMYQDLREVGLAWIAICAWCDDPDAHSGKKISAHNGR